MTGWPPRRATPLVKICGLTTPDLAGSAVEAGADLIGIVHFARSPRHLDFGAAREVAAAAKGALIVALTVNADDQTLDQLNAHLAPDVHQLHGRESRARTAEVADRYGTLVMKALGVRDGGDVEAALAYDTMLLLDAKPPEGASRPGGNGEAFDWSVLSAVPADRPFMLAGGLTPDNVADAVRQVRPYAVDVSSSVETSGAKDPSKVAAFIAAAKSAATTPA